MDKKLESKTALVTGSGRKTGIGYGIARKLASEGSNVIITDLPNKEEGDHNFKFGSGDEMYVLADELSQEYGTECIAVPVDVCDTQSVSAMVDKIKEKFSHIDILCNNAGASFGVPSAVHSYDEEAWLKTVDVNLHGVFRVSKAVLPMMLGKPGSIINTASRAGKVPPTANGAYAVAKAGVIMLTKVMAKELGGVGIRVNAICPGQIMTDLEKWRFELEAKFFNSTVDDRIADMCKTIPLGRIGTIDEAGDLVAYLASDESSYITGQAINLTGGQLMEL